MVYGGETLGRMSCGVFRPIIHQVVGSFAEPRYSLPFFLRARGNAVIDTGTSLCVSGGGAGVLWPFVLLLLLLS